MQIWSSVRTTVTAVLLVVSLAASPGQAAEPVATPKHPGFPPVGAEVRVASAAAVGSGLLVGTLVSVQATSLAVRPQNRSEAVVLSRHEIDRLQWRVRKSKKKKAALIALGVSAATGVMVTDGDVAFGVLWGGLAGLIPAGIAIAAAPGERWVDVSRSLINGDAPNTSAALPAAAGVNP